MSVEVPERATRVAELMGSLNAGAAALTAEIADVLASASWQASGIRSPRHWAMWQCGVSARRAEQLVQIAVRRDDLPSCVALFDSGALTEDAMALIAKRVPAERDEE